MAQQKELFSSKHFHKKEQLVVQSISFIAGNYGAGKLFLLSVIYFSECFIFSMDGLIFCSIQYTGSVIDNSLKNMYTDYITAVIPEYS